MKERLLRFGMKAAIYGSMWLVALFPLEILLSVIYQVKYVYPTAETLRELSSYYWGAILVPPIFRFIGRVLETVLGDIWTDIQNEWSLLTYPLVNGPVKKTFWSRLGGIVSLVLACLSVWYYVSLILSYSRAQIGVMLVWAAVVAGFMKYVQEDRRDDD